VEGDRGKKGSFYNHIISRAALAGRTVWVTELPRRIRYLMQPSGGRTFGAPVSALNRAAINASYGELASASRRKPTKGI
jgi:hypothetical protein